VPSLTQIDAAARAAAITAQSYAIDLDLTAADPESGFSSVTTLRFAARAEQTFVDVRPERLHSAMLNGQPLDLDIAFDAVAGRLFLDQLASQNELVVTATMAYSHNGEGLHRHQDPADGSIYLYAMSFLDAAPRWFACFDQPDLKAEVALTVTCPPEWTVYGNAAARRHRPGRYELAPTKPIATYQTTVIAGPYYSISSEHDGIPLGLHVKASLAPYLDREADELLAITTASLDRYHELFGIRYPFGEYHQAFVPDFNAGAMENPGCVTFRDQYVFRSQVTDAERADRATTIAHEMAHMWFGNLVTMRWWDDLWLNESFAEYLGTRVCAEVTDYPAWVSFGIARKAWGYQADNSPSTHPIAGNGSADAAAALADFDGISYAKGAAVLKQLAAHLGDDVFLGGLNAYFAQHAYANAEFADLIAAWTTAGAQRLPEWADAWLRTSGLDTIDALGRTAGPEESVLVTAYSNIGGLTRPHSFAVASFDAAGQEAGRARVTIEGRDTAIAALPAATLVLPDAADETWAKIALPSSVWPLLPDLLGRIDDPLARVVVWNALRRAVADADVPPALAVEVVVGALPAETEPAVIDRILPWAIDVVAGRYLADGSPRQSALHRLAELARRMMQQAEPGSGRQLATARALISAWTDTQALSSWLDGSAPPVGLAVDSDLRWLVIERLAVLGAVDGTQIEAELARDNSAPGRVHAARCRALRPTVAAKTAAWALLTTQTSTSNYELYATASGIWHPDQTELTAELAPRYFVDVPSISRLHSGWTAAEIARLWYPSTAVTDQTLAASNALIEAGDLEPGIARSIVDQSDQLARALAARTAFST
jgi:aminopeptidase N